MKRFLAFVVLLLPFVYCAAAEFNADNTVGQKVVQSLEKAKSKTDNAIFSAFSKYAGKDGIVTEKGFIPVAKMQYGFKANKEYISVGDSSDIVDKNIAINSASYHAFMQKAGYEYLKAYTDKINKDTPSIYVNKNVLLAKYHGTQKGYKGYKNAPDLRLDTTKILPGSVVGRVYANGDVYVLSLVNKYYSIFKYSLRKVDDYQTLTKFDDYVRFLNNTVIKYNIQGYDRKIFFEHSFANIPVAPSEISKANEKEPAYPLEDFDAEVASAILKPYEKHLGPAQYMAKIDFKNNFLGERDINYQQSRIDKVTRFFSGPTLKKILGNIIGVKRVSSNVFYAFVVIPNEKTDGTTVYDTPMVFRIVYNNGSFNMAKVPFPQEKDDVVNFLYDCFSNANTVYQPLTEKVVQLALHYRREL